MLIVKETINANRLRTIMSKGYANLFEVDSSIMYNLFIIFNGL